jgi:hypothetical protein
MKTTTGKAGANDFFTPAVSGSIHAAKIGQLGKPATFDSWLQSIHIMDSLY